MISLKNNIRINISRAHNRHDKIWKNVESSWEKMVNKLSETHRTYETQAEYDKMNKDRQDDIKDVGGFVGGHLKEGRRKNGYVLNRSLITLDADFADKDFWTDVKMLTEYACCVYSTHKHRPTSPRLRLIIPLTRPVDAEEYEAIARKLAFDIGIDQFDDTTYQATRLMYWPSTSKDGEYFFDYLDMPILDADAVLNSYPDWTDSSYWPESSRVSITREKTAAKQGDPLLKSGLIGAFCRTYTIQDVISNFLSDVYTECKGDRYTYTKGSTSGGLVIYQDRFAYSNHGTDPISGMLCNAFDLVRIHKYGYLDDDIKEKTPVNKMPSWKAMMEFASSDDNVRKTIGLERLDKATSDFDTSIDVTKDNSDWLSSLTVGRTGGYEVTIDNFLLILENDPLLKGIGGYNLFNGRYEVTVDLPWQRNTKNWIDSDDASLRHYVEKVYSLKSSSALADAVNINFTNHSFNPVKNYLESLCWDGINRVETLLIDYLGADDNKYTKDVTRKTLTAAVNRIYVPGCKFDQMLTLVGKQGEGKSTLWKMLGKEWYSDTLIDIKGKEAYEALDGVWILEMGELSATRKNDRESIKMYLSKCEDTYRKAYDKRPTVNKRMCIFIGTSNDDEFLSDATGGRRFWIVETHGDRAIKDVFNDLTDYEIDQIWAEAVVNFKSGKEKIMVLDDDVQKVAINLQEAHEESSSLKGLIEEYLNIKIPENWEKMTIYEQRSWYSATEDFKDGTSVKTVPRKRVCALEIWCVMMNKDKADATNYQSKIINECMMRIKGWNKVKSSVRYGSYGFQRVFEKA